MNGGASPGPRKRPDDLFQVRQQQRTVLLTHHGSEVRRQHQVARLRSLFDMIEQTRIVPAIYGGASAFAIEGDAEPSLLQTCGTGQSVFRLGTQQQNQFFTFVIVR